MARRTRNDFDAELLLRIANRTDITATQRGFFLDDSYLKVCNMFKHVQLQAVSTTETLLIGTDNFTPAVTDLWYPTFVRNSTDGYPIRLAAQDQIERQQTKPTTRPYMYYWYGGALIFEALADTAKTIKLWYKKKPPTWNPTASPTIDQIFDKLIGIYAASSAFEAVREFEKMIAEEKVATKYAQEQRLPLEQAKLNDYRQGFRVRLQ